jgi:hypothetical protein
MPDKRGRPLPGEVTILYKFLTFDQLNTALGIIAKEVKAANLVGVFTFAPADGKTPGTVGFVGMPNL